jgi:two-component system chemotaxis response regulator CheB
VNVLIVDDSVVFRMAISAALKEIEWVSVAGAVSNGQLAVEALKKDSTISLVTLDLEMPVMDGIETIKKIREFNKTVPIIIFSSVSHHGAEKTLQALSLGANDFVTKQESGGAASIDSSLEMIRNSLLPKVHAFRNIVKPTEPIVETPKVVDKPNPVVSPANTLNKSSVEDFLRSMTIKPKLIIIGCSTGGPEALKTIFMNIKSKATVPMLLVQHMPPIFTEKLAQRLDEVCEPIKVSEAKAGDPVVAGTCLIAPGDYHMTYSETNVVRLNQEEKICFVRPAVDALVDSVAEKFNGKVLTFILTGMGADGAESCVRLANKGDYLAIQDEESAVVWGMAGALKDKVPGVSQFKLEEIAEIINNVFERV